MTRRVCVMSGSLSFVIACSLLLKGYSRPVAAWESWLCGARHSTERAEDAEVTKMETSYIDYAWMCQVTQFHTKYTQMYPLRSSQKGWDVWNNSLSITFWFPHNKFYLDQDPSCLPTTPLVTPNVKGPWRRHFSSVKSVNDHQRQATIWTHTMRTARWLRQIDRFQFTEKYLVCC